MREEGGGERARKKKINKKYALEQVTHGASEVQSHWENLEDRREPVVLKVPSLTSYISTNWCGALFMCQLD